MTTGATLEAVGQPLDRVDGPAKVTGGARYSAEIALPGITYAALVGARIAEGRVTGMDTTAAERAPGVLAVLTHRNLPRVAKVRLLPSLAGHAAPGETFFPMQDDVVHYFGQPVALVIADAPERARFAARQVHVDYEAGVPTTTVDQGREHAYEPDAIFAGFIPGRSSRGDVEAGLREADARVDLTYRMAPNHHNPIEPSATTAVWDGDRLTLYDSTQGIAASQNTVAALLGIAPSKVRVRADFVGGGFGCKAMIWPHVTLAALAARHVDRPVKLALTREQMFTSCGHREAQEQRIELGAKSDGRLTALRHHKLSLTSHFDDWAEPSLSVASQAYDCPNYEGVYRLIRSNTMTPTFTRGPGETTGMYAMECAVDELAHTLGIDPLEMRLRNHAGADPVSGNPWSSDGAEECYRRGAERFGWQSRNPEPRSERDGDWLIGKGMATAGYPQVFPMQPQRARARLYADGSAVVQCGTQDIGTGVATAMTQVAADGLGVAVGDVHFQYGDTDLPNVAAAVGSAGSGMISAAVHTAATTLREQLIRQAVADPQSPLHGASPAGVVVRGGRMELKERPDTGESYSDLMQRRFLTDMDAIGSWQPPGSDTPYGLVTFGAQFAEVAVDPELGVVRVRRMVSAMAPGRVLNAKMAHSQVMGGMLWGMSQALLEGTFIDTRDGRWANASLGEYLVPVNADAPDVEIEFVEMDDPIVNPLGVKGLGEVGMVGAAAAVANAVFHATGRRVRELPIRIEHLL
ncbi:xanthine dehydrogenase family protein molybdopterin-binding subunit [Streptomyces odontomachi]|uniref:xanthine dehydrogenase family protein molybdopterin-binding subunit n=1 Tax=Streptomyces odontomachi TaxID=2944940 RepID=UPI00210C1C9B|nr:xanthine dehydrogenase family protein molybdopterin-binding subunit [Streptomyces sp. ODS25]